LAWSVSDKRHHSQQTTIFKMTQRSECPDVKNCKWRFNPAWHRMLHSYTRMTTVGVKGLSRKKSQPGSTEAWANPAHWIPEPASNSFSEMSIKLHCSRSRPRGVGKAASACLRCVNNLNIAQGDRSQRWRHPGCRACCTIARLIKPMRCLSQSAGPTAARYDYQLPTTPPPV